MKRENRVSAAADTIETAPGQSMFRVVAAATIGNMLEWYDFTIYAAFAIPISQHFFPTDSEVVSLLLSFITFGLGFIARPFGAVVLGDYADRKGRRNALGLTILLMAAGTGIVALCPGYDTIGIAAPCIIVAARLLQGFSAGGEIGGAVALLTETAPPEKRALFASFQQLAQGGSTMLSGLVALLIAAALPVQAVNDWGWRIAFLVGLLIAPVGFYIRRALDDAPAFVHAVKLRPDEAPILLVLRDHWRPVLTGMLIVMLWTVAQYLTNYFPTFAGKQLKLPLTSAYLGPFVVGTVLLLCPLIGALADRFRRRRIMQIGGLGLLGAAYPAYAWLIAAPSDFRLICSQIVIALGMLVYTAPASAVLAELFPTRLRATGVALTYSLGVALFGGFTPAIITALIDYTGSPIAIAFYLMAAAIVSLLTLFAVRDRTGEVLS